MFYMILYPGFSIGPAGDYGSFDFSSQWRVIQSTTLPDCDPSVNKKIIAVNSRGSSRRIRCASTRRLPLSRKPLKFEDNEQKKHSNKAGSPRSPSVYNVLSATDRKACLMTEQGFPVSLWEDPSFVYADDKSVS